MFLRLLPVVRFSWASNKGEYFMKSGKWTLLTMFCLAVGISLIVLPAVFAWDFHGRMTGGGSVCKPSGCVDAFGDSDGRVTHGFELHCAPEDQPNRLEINDHFT